MKSVTTCFGFWTFLLLGFVIQHTVSQDLYSVTPVSFNMKEYDEIAAFPYRDGIVFSSNRPQNVFIIREDSLNKPLLSLYFVKRKEHARWSTPIPLNKPQSKRFHDAFATFDKGGSTMFFTRAGKHNCEILSAEYNGTQWDNITPFPYNDADDNFIHPCLSEDGKTLFFASDKRGGSGGFDIYSCELTRGKWSSPRNLGPEINSPANEMYPFFHSNGKLYFSSNRKNGYGGLDIYYSKKINGKWITPVLLPPPINTKDDDCAFWSDSLDRHGYLSSNRNNRDRLSDIYEFVMDFPVFDASTCLPQKKNKYRYEFVEQSSVNTDTTSFLYEWDFGDGNKIRGKDLKVEHTFEKTGDYLVQLNVIDTLTGQIQLNQAANILPVRDLEQPYILCQDTAHINQEIFLDGSLTYLPDKNILNYYWDFNDGLISAGETVKHTFTEPGRYKIILGVTFTGPNKQKSMETRYKQIVITSP